MARKPRPQRLEDVEISPEAEERFRAAVRLAAKSGPQHRESKPKSAVEKVEKA
jgi:hypothetical protein